MIWYENEEIIWFTGFADQHFHLFKGPSGLWMVVLAFLFYVCSRGPWIYDTV